MNKKILLLFAVFVLFLSFSPIAKAALVPDGGACVQNADCQSNICTDNICQRTPLCQIQNATGNPNDIDPAAVNNGVQPTIENFISLTTGKGFVPCGITSAVRKSWSCRYTVNSIIPNGTTNGQYQNIIADTQANANAVCESIKGPNRTFLSATQTAQVEGILCPCQLPHLFILLLKIFRFLLFFGTLVAGLMITIGGVLIVLSGGPGGNNPVTGLVNPNMYSTAKKMIMYSIIGVVTMFCAWLIINILMVRILGIPFAWNVLWF